MVTWLRGIPVGLALSLAILVMAPAAAVYWFMTEAAGAQADAARRSVLQAYRSQLVLVRDRIEASWQSRIAALDADGGARTPYERAARLGADSIVLFGHPGQSMVYPNLGQPIEPASIGRAADSSWGRATELEFESRDLLAAAELWARLADEAAGSDPSRAASAARNQIRCLMRLSRKAEALSAMRKWFLNGPAAAQLDSAGRLIAADQWLMALQTMSGNPADREPIIHRLTALLANTDSMPVPQRLFVMDETRKLAPSIPRYDGYELDRLAVLYAESSGGGLLRPSAGSKLLQPAPIPDVWQAVSQDRRTVALYRTATVIALGEAAILPPPNGTSPRFEVGLGMAATGELSTPFGPVLGGWNVTLAVDAHPFQEAEQATRNRYLALGTLVLIAMAVSAVLGGRTLSGQMRLARLKTDLTAVVSHELRTPLASTRLLLDNLLAEQSPKPEVTREYLELLSAETERLRRLVDNFLTFSRIDRNRQTFTFEPLNPEAVARSAIQALRPESPVDVALEVAPDLPSIRGDEDAMQTVLLNLLDNAYKFSPVEKNIRMRVFATDAMAVAFVVSDNGIGIPAHEQRKIFRSFYQADRRLARERGGCGLGLSIVEYLVKAHGGRVTVQSTLGAGSSFEVRIPQWGVA